MTPVRVLVLTVVHDPEDARIRHRQLAALVDAGHAVTYAAPFEAYGRTSPVPAIDLPRASGRRRLAAVRAARRVLRSHGPGADVILLHDPDLLAALPGTLRRLRGTVVVWDVHEDTAAAIGIRGWIPRPLRAPFRWAVRRAESWAERRIRLLLAEHSYADRFSRPHPVVPNSVLVPRAEPPLPGGDRVVYLGRLTHARGAVELIEVGRRLAVDSGVHLDVIGPADGDVVPLLEQAQADGALTWHGFVPNDQAHRMLAGATAGLSLLHDEPNYAESRPTKIMEYMAHGVPVVTTPNPASRALVDASGCGVVVPFGNVDAAVAAISHLATDESARTRCARAGRVTAVAELDWSRDAERFVAVLEGWVTQQG